MKNEITSHSVKTGKRSSEIVELRRGDQLQLYDNAAHPFGFIQVVSNDYILFHLKTDEPRVDKPQQKVDTALVPLELLK